MIFRSITLLVVFQMLSLKVHGQVQWFVSAGYGAGYNITKLEKINQSYASYQDFLTMSYPDLDFTADPEFKTNSWSDIFSLQFGVSAQDVYAGISYFPNVFRQERTIIRNTSGYGRKFAWSEHRNEVLFDVGYGSKIVDVFGSFGVNFNTYRMVSYQLYPDGTESLTNEYYFNGVYKQFDAGVSYGLGIKIKPIKYVALDIRYLFANDLLLGEKNQLIEENTTLTDNSEAKTVGTSEFPQDFTQPFSFDNRIVPEFSKHYFTCSLIFYFGSYDK